jgi:hypothetical protein
VKPLVALALAGCGRVGFEPRLAADARGDVAAADPIAYVKPFAEHHPGAGGTDSFMVQASAAGDAVALQVACSDAIAPTSVLVTAGGWSITQLTPIVANGALYAASFGAIAPDTVATTLTIEWTGTTCGVGKSALGDEFANADLAGGTITFDAVTTGTGTGNCSANLTIGNANDAVWGGCFVAASVSSIGPGYAKGADNGGGDWAEYKLTSDPAGTVEAITFVNSTAYVLSGIAIKPR